MATKTIELDPANAVEPRQVTQLVGFKANGTMTAANAAGFMALREMPKNADGVQDADLATETGFYQVSGWEEHCPVNVPLSTEHSVYGVLEVLKTGNFIIQRYTTISDPTNCPVRQRVNSGKSFSSWVLISRGG